MVEIQLHTGRMHCGIDMAVSLSPSSDMQENTCVCEMLHIISETGVDSFNL